MKRIIAMIIIIFGHTSCQNLMAQVAVDHTFNYQGQLQDAGVLANDTYDIQIEAYDSKTNGMALGIVSEHLSVKVIDGIFNLSAVNLGSGVFDGFELWLQVGIRLSSVGGAYTVLTPRQKLTAVPYASQLISGNATSGQVLTFNGVSKKWEPQAPSAATPWSVNGSAIKYNGGNVGIGVGTDVQIYALQVKTSSLFPASFEGGNNATVAFKEQGVTRGLIGSGFNIGANDFSVATPNSSTGSIHLAPKTNPVLTVTDTGFVGVGTTTPNADLQIDGTGGGNILVVRKDAVEKLTVFSNGGTAIGANVLPAANGLTVSGDVKQPITSNGIMKYMFSITNCGSANVAISNSYNGVSIGGVITPQNDPGGVGSCELVFPVNVDVSNRFIQATVIGGFNAAGEGVSCYRRLATVIACTVFNTTTGAETPGDVDLLIY